MAITGDARLAFISDRRERRETMGLRGSARVVSWGLQLIVAAILAQTLFFKFTAAPESVYIFTTLGMEPWGRIGTGVAELIAVVLLLMGRTAVGGALLAAGLMVGALGAHATKLGIDVQGDHGLLFALAVVVLSCAVVVAIVRWRDTPLVGPRFDPQLAVGRG